MTGSLTAGRLLIHLIGKAILALMSISPATTLITFIFLILLAILEFTVALISLHIYATSKLLPT